MGYIRVSGPQHACSLVKACRYGNSFAVLSRASSTTLVQWYAIGLQCARYSVCGSSRGRKIDSFTINMWLKILSGILSAEVSEITVLLNWTAFLLDWQTKKDD